MGTATKGFCRFQPKKQLYQLGNESESAAEYYDMTTSDGNGEWNLDAVGNSGHRCTKCGVESMVRACVMLI